MIKTANILNKRAKFDFEIIDTYSTGIVLTGTEIKSIRLEILVFFYFFKIKTSV